MNRNFEKPTIYIRADANETIGTGHVMRCLSIGEAIRKQGGDAVFLVADSRTEDIVRSRGFSAVCLDSVWDDLEKELEQLVSWIRQKDSSVLLVDSYYVTPHYLETLRQYTKLAYIDDLNSFAYPVDMLISYAIYSRRKDYETEDKMADGKIADGKIADEKSYGNENKNGNKNGNGNKHINYKRPQILLGSRYIPLKSQFCNLPKRKISEEVKNILVLTGGTDPYHVALNLVKQAAGTKNYHKHQLHIICGKYNPDYDQLCHLASELENVRIHYNVENMADFMQAADLAVTAGGTTTYELCACGTPSICYILADNQIQNVRTFAEKGLMLFGGDVRKDGGVSEILRQIGRLSADAELRKEMSEKMQRLVDGKGAERIVEAISNLRDEPEYGEGREGLQ